MALTAYGRVPTFLDDWPRPSSRRHPDEHLPPRVDTDLGLEALGGGLAVRPGGELIALELDDVLERFDLAAGEP